MSLTASLSCPAAPAFAQRPTNTKQLPLPGETLWVQHSQAFILWPDAGQLRKPQPWVWYAPTLPGLPDEHEKWMHEQFLRAGIAVAGIDVGESYGSLQGRERYHEFYVELTTKRGFAAKPVLLGRSRGGLMVMSWASSHPDLVAGIAGIYPVFDLRSYPGLEQAAPAYELTAATLQARLDAHNPIAAAASLARARVPVFLIHGDRDDVVPLDSNSGALKRVYAQAGAADCLELAIAQGQGHNFWEGFFRCAALVEFVRQHTRAP